jgi:hypothetical protein
VGELAWAILNPARHAAQRRDRPHRRYVGVRNDLERFKEVKNQFGGTVNDVVLTGGVRRAAVLAALARVRAEGLELRALVPVSIRTPTSTTSSATGSPRCAGRCPSTSRTRSPGSVDHEGDAGPQGLQAGGGRRGAHERPGLRPAHGPRAGLAPELLHALFNLIVTNVPGPQFPLYVRGRELQDVFPVAFLPKGHALAVGDHVLPRRMNFGLLADYDAVPDLEDLGAGIEEALAELVGLARTARAAAAAARPRGHLNGHDRGPSGTPVGARPGAQPGADRRVLARARAGGAAPRIGARGSAAGAQAHDRVRPARRLLAVARDVHGDRVERVAVPAPQLHAEAVAPARGGDRRAGRPSTDRHSSTRATPDGTTRGGAPSRRVVTRTESRAARGRRGADTREVGARRSRTRAPAIAAPASEDPPAELGSHPEAAPAGRRADSLSRRMTSWALRSGLSARAIRRPRRRSAWPSRCPCR